MAAVLTAALSVGTAAFAADSTDLSTLPQVYAKDSLFTLDKEHVAGGTVLCTASLPLPAHRPHKNKLLRKSVV